MDESALILFLSARLTVCGDGARQSASVGASRRDPSQRTASRADGRQLR